jgi:hypothetical protein
MRSHDRDYLVEVVILDMAPILPQMHGNAVGTSMFDCIGSFSRPAGRGYVVPRACRNVATWSIFTPRKIELSSVI